MDLTKLALGHNPTCSVELWNTLGDGLYPYGPYAEARGVYQQALRLDGFFAHGAPAPQSEPAQV